MMPDMDGLSFCRAVRAQSTTAGIPVVMLSASSPEELGWPVGGDGPTVWLRKPFDPKTLIDEVRRVAAEFGKR